MRPIIATLAAALLVSGTASARAADSQAQSWNLTGETKERFEATVIDILCELAGDCVADCGGGSRQLGLLRADGTLVLASKNGEPIFSGAAVDLAPYCGKQVEVDGLMVGGGDTRIYQIQLIREVGEPEFRKADRWSKAWNEAHPELTKEEGPWFRKDPLIRGEIEREGYFGLGLETDRKYIEDSK